MALKLITAPASEPVTLTEAKAHLRIDTTDDDALITSLIIAARSEAEKITRRALVNQTWELALDSFHCREISLPFPRLQSVTSVKYVDVSGVEQTLDTLMYQVDADSEPARIAPVYGAFWPATMVQLNAVRIRYVAGYGAAAATVPDAIKAWIKVRVATLYENREGISSGNVSQTPFIDGLLDEYRVITF